MEGRKGGRGELRRSLSFAHASVASRWVRLFLLQIREEPDAYHRSVGNQSNESVRRDQAQRDDENVSEGFEVVSVEAGVHDEEEDGRDLSWSGKGVFDGGVFWKELRREVVGGEVLVVRREGVSLKAEGTDPEFGSDVELAGRKEE